MEDVYYACWRCEGGGGLHDGLSDSLDSVLFSLPHDLKVKQVKINAEIIRIRRRLKIAVRLKNLPETLIFNGDGGC